MNNRERFGNLLREIRKLREEIDGLIGSEHFNTFTSDEVRKLSELNGEVSDKEKELEYLYRNYFG